MGEGRGRRGVARFGPLESISATILIPQKIGQKSVLPKEDLWTRQWRGVRPVSGRSEALGVLATSKPLLSRPPSGRPGWSAVRVDCPEAVEWESTTRSTWLEARSSCCATGMWSRCSRCARHTVFENPAGRQAGIGPILAVLQWPGLLPMYRWAYLKCCPFPSRNAQARPPSSWGPGKLWRGTDSEPWTWSFDGNIPKQTGAPSKQVDNRVEDRGPSGSHPLDSQWQPWA